MGVCFSAPATEEAARRYREQSVIDEDVARAMELLYPPDDPDELEMSDGRITTENQFLTSVRVAATKVQSRLVHGINDDADQFCEPFQHPEMLLKGPQRKFILAWVDDHLQHVLRSHLLERLPKALQLKPITSFATANQSGVLLNSFANNNNTAAAGGSSSGIIMMLSSDEAALSSSTMNGGSGAQRSPPPPPICINADVPLVALEASAKKDDVDPTRSVASRPAPIVMPMSPSILADGQQANRNSNPTDGDHVLTPTSLMSDSTEQHGETHLPAMRSVSTLGLPQLNAIVDIAFLVRVINAYCKPPHSSTVVHYVDRKGRRVTLGDPLSAFTHTNIGTHNTNPCSEKEARSPSEEEAAVDLVPEFLDMTTHFNKIDRQDQRAMQFASSANNTVGTFLSDVMSPGVANASVMGSVFSDGENSMRLPIEDLSEVPDESILSPTSGASLVDMSSSPYAAHGSPWKERTLNTETMDVHNKFFAMREKKLLKQLQQMPKAALEAERRPRVLMQLLFGPVVLPSFLTQLQRQLSASGGGAMEGEPTI